MRPYSLFFPAGARLADRFLTGVVLLISAAAVASSALAQEPTSREVGTIALMGTRWMPKGWARCDGRLLWQAKRPDLYQRVGMDFGGSVNRTFALPDLRSTEDVLRKMARVRTNEYELRYPNSPEQRHVGSLTYIMLYDGQQSRSTLPLVGEITLCPAERHGPGWVPCDGRRLPINAATRNLFSVIGNKYGGNGQTDFAVPNFHAAKAKFRRLKKMQPDLKACETQLQKSLTPADTRLAAQIKPELQRVQAEWTQQRNLELGPLQYIINLNGIVARADRDQPQDHHYLSEVVCYAGAHVPQGYLRCDGVMMHGSRDAFQPMKLYSLLGEAFLYTASRAVSDDRSYPPTGLPDLRRQEQALAEAAGVVGHGPMFIICGNGIFPEIPPGHDDVPE